MSFFNVPENLGFYDHTFVLQAKLQLGLISPAFVTQNTPFLNNASEEECQKMKVLCDRLHGLYSDDLEEAARWNISFLGKLERPSLNTLEEKLLAVLEAQ